MQVTCAALLPDGLTMPATSRFPFFAYLFACLLGLFALGGFWYGLGKPVLLPDVVSATHKLQCASYTPFDKDHSTYRSTFVPSAWTPISRCWPKISSASAPTL